MIPKDNDIIDITSTTSNNNDLKVPEFFDTKKEVKHLHILKKKMFFRCFTIFVHVNHFSDDSI